MTVTDQPAAHDTLAQLVAAALIGEYGPAQFATPSEVLAVLLDGGDIREEWGCRHVWTTGQRVPEDRWGFRDRADAESFVEGQRDAAFVALAERREWVITAQLVRRFVISTAAATVVEDS